MFLKRKILNDLIEWRNNDCFKSALLIEGARRIGKSTIASEFGKNYFKSYLSIDFSKVSKKIKDNFLDNLDNLDLFFQNLSILTNTRFYYRDTLFIFDEVQKFPRAREAIKHLVADGRYAYLETGSLISIKENVNDILIPSEETKLKMYPLDFEEFLLAKGENIFLDYLKKYADELKPLNKDFHNKGMRLFYEYMLIGGMPQTVCAYIETHGDFYRCDKINQQILSLYKDDIKKSSKKYNLKIENIFNNIPGYLSKHDKKITLKSFDNNGTFDRYSDALYWLNDSMICNLCYKCNDPSITLNLNLEESCVKCYLGDTGLLSSFVNIDCNDKNMLYKKIINGNLSMNKGMLFENVVAQTLKSLNKDLFFYTHYSLEKRRNDIEIDFLLVNKNINKFSIVPIEVKSSKNYNKISYDKFIKRFKNRIGKSIIIHPKNLSVTENEIKIPPYMMLFILKNI